MGNGMKFLKQNRAQSEFSTIYIVLIFAIAAVLLISIVKPMFANTTKVQTPLSK